MLIEVVAQSSQPAPPCFAPGALLPSLIAAADTPIVFATDWVWGYEGVPMIRPLLVLAHPLPSNAATRPGQRLVRVELNGSGRPATWTFSPDGQYFSYYVGSGTADWIGPSRHMERW